MVYRIVIYIAILLAISSCSRNAIDIKSPCVANGISPCGEKRPVNDWWLKDYLPPATS